MFDGLGALRCTEKRAGHLVLETVVSTRIIGLLSSAFFGALSYVAYCTGGGWFLVAALLGSGVSTCIATFERKLTFARSAGVLVMEGRVLWFRRQTEIPLFRIRKVTVQARPVADNPLLALLRPRYVCYLERRGADPVYLDEGKRMRRLRKIADSIGEVTDLPIEFDHTAAQAGPN